MAYVKISDPKIIDLSTVHQIINVVNQHSDNITALTNNFGSVYTGSAGITSGNSTEYQYDISSQQVIYGKTKIDSTVTTWTTVTSGGKTYGYFSVPVTFAGQPFSAAPIVLTNLNLSTTSNPNLLNLVTWAGSVSTSSFNINLRSIGNDVNTWLGSSTPYVNWIAIGPK